MTSRRPPRDRTDRAPRLPLGRPGSSMALLEEVLDPPVGPGYHSAAEQRLAAGRPASSGTRTWLMLLTCVVLGLVGTVTVTVLRTPDPASAQVRSDLIDRIEAAQALGDAERDHVEQLRAEIVELENLVIDQDTDAAREERRRARGQAGGEAVRGPGVVITLRDAPRPDEVTGDLGQAERVNARDLQVVVNALWAAGAEAIAVNDHRMTSTSAIRFAGKAIVVDFRGLTQPYEIRAIGAPRALQTEIRTGLVGSYLQELRQQFAIESEAVPSDDLTVPAAERLTTRVGRIAEPAPATEDDPTPGAPATTPSENEEANR